MKLINNREIFSVISFTHVECAAIGLHAFQNARDQDVGVGIIVAMRMGRQIVRNQIGSDLDVLGNRLSMISRHSRRN